MKIAIIGSRKVKNVDIQRYLPKGCEEIISGGACGVDACAQEYAQTVGLPLRVFYPQYERYGRGAPIVRNREIVEYADEVLAFWDGRSAGTRWVIRYCEKVGKACRVILCAPEDEGAFSHRDEL
jgi:hypothetical protein